MEEVTDHEWFAGRFNQLNVVCALQSAKEARLASTGML
jgi:hypothetical protein